MKNQIDALGLGLDLIGVGLKCLIFIIKLKNILNSLETLHKLLQFLNKDWCSSCFHIRKRVKTINNILRILLFVAMLSITCSVVTLTTLHTIPVKIWQPFDIESNKIMFHIVSMYFILHSAFISFSNITTDIVPLIFISY